MTTLDLIVPCYNEEEVLPLFYDTTVKMLQTLQDIACHIIFVDDGSRDNTASILRAFAQRDSRVQYITFSRNFGKEAAILAGLRMSSAQLVGILDADLQHPPEMIPQMLCAVRDEGYDVAAAYREHRNGEGKIRSAFSKLFYKVNNRITDTEMHEGAQDFRLMKRKVADAILSMPEYNRFSKGVFSWVGFQTKWFAHENVKRAGGKSKWSFRKLFSYAVDGIINFSTVPLKIALVLGSLSSAAGLIYALYIIIRTLLYGSDVPGYPSIICAISIFGGFILLSLGVLGEYIARIYMEVKHRPNYIINETNILPKNAENSEEK